ncbi:hypothetical protein VDG1235_3015 [Verrucomicrobiia bacterium DG1235]|nr:hypothetical protein VDG1235_3015 [Verrucomicrobiae bacterium DG1235]
MKSIRASQGGAITGVVFAALLGLSFLGSRFFSSFLLLFFLFSHEKSDHVADCFLDNANWSYYKFIKTYFGRGFKLFKSSM